MFNNIQVFVKGIVIDENNNHVVMLSDKEETKVLPIVIGPVEAMAILMNMQGITPNRPLTHNLLKNLLDLLGAEVEQIIITNIKDNVYYANLYIKHDKYTFEVDSRPSDAIAIALAYNAPIYMNLKLIEFTVNPSDLNVDRS
ncbi:MAG TPA: bifunctional nuclease family protein [Acetomicrobium sp.]|jgi:bifunctional DNase/RNase|nr:bifunctional nuclease family protein [Synergistota bacterium]HOB10205.1 bifunctional nuclease family protein [Acetomicrobium sp.]HPT64623.1 bifunctional nuclease family protein [Acetomicrobium sp.]